MPKKPKLATPEWILEGYDSKEKYEKSKKENIFSEKTKDVKKSKKGIFRIKLCPECKSENVKIIVSGEFDDDEECEKSKSKVMWGCDKCGWKGENIFEKELNEKEFEEYADKQEGRIK